MAKQRKTRTHAVTEEAVDARKAEILTHASRVIAAVGFERCSFGAVSDACGFSIGMIQHYFRTRQLLLIASVEYRAEQTVKEWRRIYALTDHPIERIYALLTLAVEGDESFADAWGFWVQVYALGNSNEEARARAAVVLESWRGLFVEALIEAAASGELGQDINPQELGSIIVAVADGLAVQTLNRLYGSTPASMKKMLHTFVASQLGIDPADFQQRNSHTSER